MITVEPTTLQTATDYAVLAFFVGSAAAVWALAGKVIVGVVRDIKQK